MFRIIEDKWRMISSATVNGLYIYKLGRLMNQTIKINTASKAYDVIIGTGLLDRAGELSKTVIKPCKTVIVSDSNVSRLYLGRLKSSLEKAGFEVISFIFPAGEQSKNSETLFELLEYMAENGLTRNDAVFALGGGVTGDVAGFAAAIYMRGIRFIQLPTTLLAAVDSSVGGKTGIDLKAGKNLAGAFWQPELVVCDTDLLNTLPEVQISDGWSEIVKYSIIRDRELFDILLNDAKPEPGAVIARCVGIKRDIVTEDEKETGLRMLLNFGHTVGHAIEKCSDYRISHGQAVAIGMAVITRAAVKMGLCGPDCLAGLLSLLKKYKLPDSTDIPGDKLFEAMLSDKKRGSGGLTLVVPEEIGRCVLKTMSLDKVREMLRLGLSA